MEAPEDAQKESKKELKRERERGKLPCLYKLGKKKQRGEEEHRKKQKKTQKCSKKLGINWFQPLMEAVMNMPALAAAKEASRSCSFVQEELGGNISAKFRSSRDLQSCDGGESSKSSSLISLKDSGLNRQSSMEIASEMRSSSAMDLSISSWPSSSSTSKIDSSITFSKMEKLESTKAEIREVMDENKKLKMVLARMVKDYQALQTHVFDVMQRERPPPKDQEPEARRTDDEVAADRMEEEDLELVSLSLGTSSSTKKAAEKAPKICKSKGGLTLGLVPKGGSRPESSSDGEPKAGDDDVESGGEAAGPPGKKARSLTSNGEEDEQASQHAHVKKARVSVRARCDAPTKIAKGNPCPKAYYRCTVAPACLVRKQVQRCTDDMSILITTYEGTHNHPLPFSATAMASTTSAAVSMLMSGSSAAGPSPIVSPAPPSGGAIDSRAPTQFYLPSPSMAPSPPLQTVTFNLENPRPPPSTSFSFSSSESSGTTTSSAAAAAWSNGYQNYGALQLNKAILGHSIFESRRQGSFYQSCLQSAPAAAEQSPLTETIAKAVKADPGFRSALTAAISSYVGGGGGKAMSNGIMNLGGNLDPSAALALPPPHWRPATDARRAL